MANANTQAQGGIEYEVVAQGTGGIWTQKSHDQNCTVLAMEIFSISIVLAGMSKDLEVHLSLTLNFSYQTKTLRQINYRVLGKGCIISRIFLSHSNQTQLPIRKQKSFITFVLFIQKNIQTINRINKCVFV